MSRPATDPSFSTKRQEIEALEWWLATHADNFERIVAGGDPAKILRWAKAIHERAARYAELRGANQ